MSLAEKEFALLTQGIEELGLECTESQIEQMFSFAGLILKWNKVYNLTAITRPEEVITHHLLDSLAAVPVLTHLVRQSNQRLLDVGAGAGLPGLVFSIMCPALQITTIDTVHKKVAFMQQAIAVLGLKNAQAVHARVEKYHPEFQYDFITSRAFSTLSNLIEWSHHLLSDEGRYFALKGKASTDNQLPEGWKIESTHALNIPFLSEERNIFVITR